MPFYYKNNLKSGVLSLYPFLKCAPALETPLLIAANLPLSTAFGDFGTVKKHSNMLSCNQTDLTFGSQFSAHRLG
ncbi:hypothetical protein CLOSTMETH_01118 [[Clostridium] methylpentosum DSM 5476]|uniref:Uncharacterized protein n=1 Tax=[Clostridium] methylpentosum DSM 5476 TaxID=537013 RepID=C0EBA0_9FIRM|nr:hypothetical protein CLOSTMETH_01118 [[Clostridium] methylpentosum DSM 5476]